MEFSKIFLKSNSYLGELIRDYDTSPLHSYYEKLELECNFTNGLSNKFRLDTWLENGEEFNNILLLGEFGTGKTSFCKKLARDGANIYNRDQCNRIPVLIYLGRFQGKDINIKNIILETLSIKEIKINQYSEFDEANKNGRILLIFDGLDELSPKNDKTLIRENIKKINQVIYPLSKVLITCRTEYFESVNQVEELFKSHYHAQENIGFLFRLCFLKYLNDKQIENIIKKRFRRWSSEYNNQIKDTENLREIARRPIFLDKIMSTLNFIINQQIRNPNISQIYELHINNYLENQYKKRSTMLPGWFAVKILIQIAGHMHDNKTYTIKAEEIRKLIKTYFSQDLKELNINVSAASNSIITHTFLSGFDDKGHYKFNHPTFQYYFRAKCLYDAIENQDPEPFRVDFIGAETILFIKDMLHLDVKETLMEWLDNENIDIQKYAVIFLGFIEENCLPAIAHQLRANDRKEIIKRLKLIIDENKNKTDFSKQHLVKHAKISVSILKRDFYKEDLNEIYNTDRDDYTHRWYALLGMEKLISVEPRLKNYFFNGIKNALEHENNRQIKRLADKIF